MRTSRRLPISAALLAIAALPFVAERLRSPSERCTMDGSGVSISFRVRIVERDATVRPFCGVRCADRWLARTGAAPRAVLVTDCTSGREVKAEAAWFLYTITGWEEGVPDYIRVFNRRSEAERHARSHGGELLMGPERPLVVLADRRDGRPR